MKKIGILFGMEETFPWALIERINDIGGDQVKAEAVKIRHVIANQGDGYDVILDRISQDIPFYRSMLKNAALTGTYVMNNPFWWSADEKFFNYALTTKLDIPTPKTVLLPSYHRPDDTSEKSFRNLSIIDWDSVFEYVGLPAFLKPHAGGGWKHVYKIESKEDFFEAYHQTGQLVMTLQEGIDFTSYYRCYGMGFDKVHIMPYDPREPHHLRYRKEPYGDSPELIKQMEELVKKINRNLGYEFNTVEFAVKDGIPYAIDFGNPAPDAEKTSVGEENFEWVVQAAAELLIDKALNHSADKYNMIWGDFVKETMR